MQLGHTGFLTFAFAYFLFFGALTLLGGIIGYVKARSAASLIAGAVSGLLLIAGALLSWNGHLKGGLILLLLISLALLGRFLPSLLRGKLNPAAYIAPLSAVGVALAGWALYSLPAAL